MAIELYGPRFYRDARDPGTSEEAPIEQNDFFVNTLTGDLFICIDPTVDALLWIKYALAA